MFQVAASIVGSAHTYLCRTSCLYHCCKLSVTARSPVRAWLRVPYGGPVVVAASSLPGTLSCFSLRAARHLVLGMFSVHQRIFLDDFAAGALFLASARAHWRTARRAGLVYREEAPRMAPERGYLSLWTRGKLENLPPCRFRMSSSPGNKFAALCFRRGSGTGPRSRAELASS
jgi:hypothetical protein